MKSPVHFSMSYRVIKLYSISIRHDSYRLSNPSNGILHWIIPSNANKKISSLFLSQSVTLLCPV